MLGQAVVNLVGNAVKFTPEDGHVAVRTILDIKTGKLLLRVEDSGSGIAAKDLPVLLDRSDRGAPSGEGAGLGLVLTRHVVEAVHGGRLTIESTPGMGSSFGFELDPVARPPLAPVSGEAEMPLRTGR